MKLLDVFARKGKPRFHHCMGDLNGIGMLVPSRCRDLLERQFRSIVADFFAGRVLDWQADDVEACARLMEKKRRRGEPLEAHLPDAMLAGLAVSRNLVVVTRNEGRRC